MKLYLKNSIYPHEDNLNSTPEVLPLKLYGSCKLLHAAAQLKHSRTQALPQNLWASECPGSSQPGSQRALMTSPSGAPVASWALGSNKTAPLLFLEPRLLKEQDMKSQLVRGALLIRHRKQSSGLSWQPFKMYLNERSIYNFPRRTPEPKWTRKKRSITECSFAAWEPGRLSRVYRGLSNKAPNHRTLNSLRPLPPVSESMSRGFFLCYTHSFSYIGLFHLISRLLINSLHILCFQSHVPRVNHTGE